LNRLIFIGDLHCGGHYSLWPKEWLDGTREWTAQKYLYDCWNHFIENVGYGDLLVLMGDLIEGSNAKAKGTGLHTTDLGEQIKGAIHLLEPLRKRFTHCIRANGTPYHEDQYSILDWADSELEISESSQILNVKLDEGILNIAHHPQGGSSTMLGSKMDKMLKNMLIASNSGKLNKVRWMVRAHLHEFALYNNRNTTIVQTPCWKLADFYFKKMNYEAYQPDIGWVEMVKSSHDSSGYAFIEHLYDNPFQDEDPVISFEQANTTKKRRSS
jgi:hypothetical protein